MICIDIIGNVNHYVWAHSQKYFRSVPGLRQVRLTKSRVPYRCGRTHARLADARHDRHAQIFRKQHERRVEHARTLRSVRELFFSFFSFSFLFFILPSHYGSTIPVVLLSAICNDACVFTGCTIQRISVSVAPNQEAT